MNKKDIDFGLKDIKIDDYKLKKNNSGKLIFIIILIVVTIFYYKYSSKELVDQIDSSNFKSLNNVEQNNNNLTKDTLVSHNQDSLVQLNDLEQSNEEIAVNSSKTIEVNLLSGKYYIISGSFSNYNLSLNKANFLNDNGFNAFIISPVNQNKMFRVAVDVYDDIDTAKENLKSYKEKLNNELWILKY